MAKASGMFPEGKAGQAGKRNAQTRTLVRGKGRAREMLRPEEALKKKKKKIKEQKGHCSLTHCKPLSGDRKFALLSHPHVAHQQIHGPTQLPTMTTTTTMDRHVMLPKDIAKLVPKTHLMSESEWRNLGVQQSQGWVHYMIHEPEPHILLFRRPLPKKPKK